MFPESLARMEDKPRATLHAVSRVDHLRVCRALERVALRMASGRSRSCLCGRGLTSTNHMEMCVGIQYKGFLKKAWCQEAVMGVLMA